mmetsp:Transcript_11842/g.17645  ORF Transcript_11842/g.17645 Transcript_11842/m.17645 type:complete len:256 (+) Transcript_11842:249-1016(+)
MYIKVENDSGVWINMRTDEKIPILHANGGIKNQDRSIPSFLIPAHRLRNMHKGRCSVFRKLASISRITSKSHEIPQSPFLVPDCTRSVHLCQCNDLENFHSAIYSNCTISRENLRLMLSPDNAAIGFWLEFSNIRLSTHFDDKTHRQLALAIYGGTNLAGIDDFLLVHRLRLRSTLEVKARLLAQHVYHALFDNISEGKIYKYKMSGNRGFLFSSLLTLTACFILRKIAFRRKASLILDRFMRFMCMIIAVCFFY